MKTKRLLVACVTIAVTLNCLLTSAEARGLHRKMAHRAMHRMMHGGMMRHRGHLHGMRFPHHRFMIMRHHRHHHHM